MQGIVIAKKVSIAPRDTTLSSPPGAGVCHWTMFVLIRVCAGLLVAIATRFSGIPTDTKVPGRKNKVTRVMILMKMASCFICCVMYSTRSAEYFVLPASSLLASTLRYSRIPYSCFKSAEILASPLLNSLPELFDLQAVEAEFPFLPFAPGSRRRCPKACL